MSSSICFIKLGVLLPGILNCYLFLLYLFCKQNTVNYFLPLLISLSLKFTLSENRMANSACFGDPTEGNIVVHDINLFHNFEKMAIFVFVGKDCCSCVRHLMQSLLKIKLCQTLLFANQIFCQWKYLWCEVSLYYFSDFDI